MDKRVVKSREAIKKALVRLSREKSYTSISIRDLCREAGVSRTTFYNNYRLFNDVIVEMSDDFMQKLEGRRLSREFLDFLLENGDELKLLLDYGVFGEKFSAYLKNLIAEDMKMKADTEDNDLALNILTLYHAYGFFGSILNILDNIGTPNYEYIYEVTSEALLKQIEDFSVKD